MAKQCCAKPNITTYSDGSGVCQSCRTEFAAGEAVVSASTDPDVIAGLVQRVEVLEGENSELNRQIGENRDAVASLERRVLGLEGQAGGSA